LLSLSLVASVYLGVLIPVANYIGEHKFSCDYRTSILGVLVGDEIYTFGGCFPIPYIIDPDSEEENFGMFNDHTNVSETIQIYDIKKDEWAVETETKLPFAWKKAQFQIYKNTIYLHSIETKYWGEAATDLWKYDTDLKKFSHVSDMPFVWNGALLSCENGDKIYFAGTQDGSQRNIVQVYNIEQNQWEKPLFLNMRINIEKMICHNDSIKFLGTQVKPKANDIFRNYDNDQTYELVSTDYHSGNTIGNGFNITVNSDRRSKVVAKDDWLYSFTIHKTETVISKVNIITRENVTLGTMPYTIEKPLLIPYQDDQVFIFGGG
jgi:hypothetical protein